MSANVIYICIAMGFYATINGFPSNIVSRVLSLFAPSTNSFWLNLPSLFLSMFAKILSVSSRDWLSKSAPVV